MTLHRLLIANRGEIAVRITRTARDLGIETVGIHPADDADAGHVRQADEACLLPGAGAAASLDGNAIVGIARDRGCDAVHPGYGFLSENAAFARACEAAGLRFVGPAPETLDTFGDKARARALARDCGVPVLAGIDRAVTLDEARAFLDSLGPGGAMMVKAVAGGGGRGIRPVRSAAELPRAFERCASEAAKAFGSGALYVERLLGHARHLEVQVAGDGTGAVVHLWERECTIQRQRQKLIEIAPAPDLSASLRERLVQAAVAMARAARLRNLATFEFLVAAGPDVADGFVFIEANARLQVEHTVTEAITGLDLVRLQLDLAAGATFADLGITQAAIPGPRGTAMQLRVNAEVIAPDGTVQPAGGTITAFDIPAGPGVRVDTAAHAGLRIGSRYDSLLAKVIVHAVPCDLASVTRMGLRVLSEFRVEGIGCNIDFLLNLLAHPRLAAGDWTTTFVDEEGGALAAAPPRARRHGRDDATGVAPSVPLPGQGTAAPPVDIPAGMHAVTAPVAGTVVSLDAVAGDTVAANQPVAILEAMKMEHVVGAPFACTIQTVHVSAGDTLAEGTVIAVVSGTAGAAAGDAREQHVDPDFIRPDLAELQRRRAMTLDDARPDARRRRHEAGRRTARENVADVCDPGSFHEYGAFVIAAQRGRRTLDDLAARTPADGLVMGIGRVNGALFPDSDARAVVMSYDYTVLAGTQGSKNHEKKDRMFELAAEWRLPVVIFAEGGGGRPGDVDTITAGSLHIKAFTLLARLSGLVPLVGIVSGRCFAGNAVVAGCCDVIIATERSALGMGGPAMIEGGGLGTFQPDEIGPTDVQRRNGVIDIVVRDEAEAAQVARKYLSYFQGATAAWDCADQRALRHAIPENRLRVYDVHRVIETLADTGSVLELRRDFARNMITALVRVEGRPMGVLANNAMVLGGAIDADAADKAARFLQLCDAFDIPVLSLCDTPGNMVGPDAERTALVRHCCRLYVTGANITVPVFSVVLRKAYGLGAQGMVGGSFHVPFFTVAWPTGEFGPMNLEGAVKLGFRKELEAIEDPAERSRRFEEMVAESYERGKALSTAMLFEIDDVIDPADTRSWIVAGLRSLPPKPMRTGRKRGWVDTW